MKNSAVPILLADDDADDRYLIKSAFEDCRFANPLHFVEDGVELMDYLLRQGTYQDSGHLAPGIILLDLNMPRKDGREALREIKAHPQLKSIPIIILTTTKSEEEVVKTYVAGANCFITKPANFEELIGVIGSLGKFWLDTASIPVKA